MTLYIFQSSCYLSRFASLQVNSNKGQLKDMSRIIKVRRKFVIQQEPVLPPEEVSEMSPLFTDTTCTMDAGSFSKEEIYKLFEDENPRIIVK